MMRQQRQFLLALSSLFAWSTCVQGQGARAQEREQQLTSAPRYVGSKAELSLLQLIIKLDKHNLVLDI